MGGAGVNAVDRMIEAGIAGVEFIAVNTDVQSLQQSEADVTVASEGLSPREIRFTCLRQILAIWRSRPRTPDSRV